MTKLLQNKRALITGGCQGIGLAIAKALAAEGANVVLGDLKPREEAAEAIRAMGVDATVLPLDISDEGQIVEMFAKLDSVPIDILINNAGSYGPVKRIVEMDRASWDRTVSLNLTGTMLCTREALKRMIPQKRGNIINIASNVARRGLIDRGCYVATKWAVLGFTQTVALECAPHNIRANSILPGPVSTPHLDEVMHIHAQRDGLSVDKVAEAWRDSAPMKRFIESEEIGRVAVFLASELSSAMTGQGINVTGGFIMT
jgi:NAD(P)-dependent dehydrogenase (short-subunit alcohol dehydrogenase family)